MSPPVFKMGDFPIDEPRPIKVAVIGAGYSGALLFNANYTLYSLIPDAIS